MSARSDNGRAAQPRPRFIHTDVISAYSLWRSPSTPDDYVRALARQYPLGPDAEVQHRPSLAIADYGLHSAVKAAVACDRAGVDHLVALRVRVVPQRAYRTWSERVGELILLAIDESGWLSLVGLNNRGFLSGSDRGRPRVDWSDLEKFSEGLMAISGMPGGGGILSSAIEHSQNPAEPIEAYGLVRRLMELYPDRLYLELAYHGNAAEKLVNRGLVAIAQRMDLPLVATGGVRFARPEDALAHQLLEAIGRSTRADGVLGGAGREGSDLPTITVEAARAQAYLKSPQQMWRAFNQMPAALEASVEIAERCKFRLPLARPKALGVQRQRLGPELLFGLEPARALGEQQLAELVARALPARFAETGRGELSEAVLEHARNETQTICASGLADLVLFAHDVGRFCAEHDIPVAARGSATSSLVAWALRLSDVCPLDHGLDGRMFAHDGRQDLPDLDLEVASLHESVVSAFVHRGGFLNAAVPERAESDFPNLRTIRVGVHVSMGARQAVRTVGAALGMEAPRVNSVARQVPLLSSPGAIDEIMTRAPELGIPDAGAGVEPYNTLVRVAGKLEGLPHRYGAHPSAYTFSFYGPGALAWLPAHWVSDGRPGRRRTFGGARHLAVVAEERAQNARLAHPAADPANLQAANRIDIDDDTAGVEDITETGGPVICLQWTKEDLEQLALVRLDISPTAAMAMTSSDRSTSDPDAATEAAAWRLLEAGDTLCLSQVESVGFRMLLRRAHEVAAAQPRQNQALSSIEDLAQLLALWKPGVYSKEREDAYLDARFAGQRPAYPHPAMAPVLDPTAGQVLFADQLIGLVGLLGFDHAWAERFRRALAGGRPAGRDIMERAIREAGARHRWTMEQSNALLNLLLQHVGYLHLHGHALAMAQHVFRQACAKVNPATSASFFCETLNNGGSTQYGLGSAVEEARRFGVQLLPPCVNSSSDRFVSEESGQTPLDLQQLARGPIGCIRVPLTAIRGLGPEAAQHILAVRAAFGDYASLLDFCRKVDRRIVSRHDLIMLIKLGAFGFTGLSRAQLMAAEQYYASTADLLRFGDSDPAAIGSFEDELSSGAVLRHLQVAEWSPDVVAAYELAHLGFLTASPLEVQKHAQRLAEEFGVTNIAELVDYPDKAPASIGAVVTNLRIRTTRKGEKMAWLSLSDPTGVIEAALFPNAFERLAESHHGDSPLREGAFVVARGRLAHEEATGCKLFIDSLVPLSSRTSQLSALLVAIQEQQPDEWTAMGA